MAVLICGSLAFDTIMTFEGRFAQQILPEQLHVLNVSFLVPVLRRDFGGCAPNTSSNLKFLLPQSPPQPPPATPGVIGHQLSLSGAGAGPAYRAGHDHDRPRQQPDHGLSPGRNGAG